MPTGRRGRPPEGGPPARFTRSGTFADDTGWIVSEHDDPGEVAAAYAQQQLVAAVRQKLGRNVTAADVAQALGRGRADRTVPEVWNGRRAISMRMWFALALVYDLDLLSYCDRSDRRTLLPAAHRTWLDRWRPGDGLPRFRSPSGLDGEPAWTNAARDLSVWIDEENEAGRLRLADTRVATHALVGALTEAGLPVGLVSGPPQKRLVYDTEPPIELAVHLIPDSPSVTQDHLRRVVDDLHELAHLSSGRTLAVLLAAQRSMQRLDALIPGWLSAVAFGDSVRVPPSTTRGSPQPGDLPQDLTLVTLASDFAVNGYTVRIHELHKNGTPLAHSAPQNLSPQ